MTRKPDTLPLETADSTALEIPDTRASLAPPQVPVSADGAFAMMQSAIERGTDPEALKGLYELYKTMKADAAREAFNKAMLSLQNSCPSVIKNAMGQFGPYAKYDYAVSVIKPHAQKNGLSWSFEHEPTTEDGWLRVVMTIRHVGGHSETFKGPRYPTAPANRGTNAQQGVGSAETYAIRRVFLAGLGIATTEDDDAKSASGGEFITEEQAATLDALIDEVKANRASFLRFAEADQMAHIPKSKYRLLVKMLETKRGSA